MLNDLLIIYFFTVMMILVDHFNFVRTKSFTERE